MKREILFHGKRIDNGEWVEGCYVHRPDIHDAHFIVALNSLGTLLWFEVDPDTVGQYTGLTDKNGRKVFEGDILRFTDESAGYEWIGRVEFGNPNGEYNWGFQLVHVAGAKANTDTLLWFDMEETGAYCEVIGNIHDNPELLNQSFT